MFVYALVDPRTNQVRYVGMAMDAEKRLYLHLCKSQRYNPQKDAWFDELAEEGLRPVLLILEADVSPEEILTREAYWIRYYLDVGAQLTNIAIPSLTPSKRIRRTPPAPPVPVFSLVDEPLSLQLSFSGSGSLLYTPEEQEAILHFLHIQPECGGLTKKEAACVFAWRAKEEEGMLCEYNPLLFYWYYRAGRLAAIPISPHKILYPVDPLFRLPLLREGRWVKKKDA